MTRVIIVGHGVTFEDRYLVRLHERTYAGADTLKRASELVRAYIDGHFLGSRDWDGGEVFESGAQIATVSYNGRVWDNSAKEVIL